MPYRPRILVIEKAPFLRDELADALVREGFLVCAVDCPDRGLTALSAFEPHVVIVDASLPEAHRVERTERRRVVAFAGDPREANRLRHDAFVRKPFRLGRMVETVRGLASSALVADAP
jgi:DNA-binding response OmpR family regulator